MKRIFFLSALSILLIVTLSAYSESINPISASESLQQEQESTSAGNLSLDDTVKKRKSLQSTIGLFINNQKKFSQIDGEVPLDMAVPEVAASFAENIIESTPFYLKVKGVPLALKAAEIPTTAVVTLSNAAAQLTCDPACTSTNQVAGVRISYGVTSAFKLILYYRPLLFCFEGGRYGQGGKFFGSYALCKEGSNYYYSGTKFEAVPDVTVMTQDIARYKDKVEGIGIIRDPLSTTTETFNPTQDITGDVEAVIFPIQELLAVCNAAGKPNMRFWNAVEKIVLDNNAPLIKHTLLMSSETVSVTAGNLIPPTGALFSNLSHICPPSCNANRFTFILATKP